MYSKSLYLAAKIENSINILLTPSFFSVNFGGDGETKIKKHWPSLLTKSKTY